MMRACPRIAERRTGPRGGWWRLVRVAAAASAAGFAAVAAAQPATPSPRDVTVPTPADAPIPYLETVVAPGARCAVVSDVANVLIVGHGPQADGRETFLAVYPLDARGQVPPATPAMPAAGDRPARPLVPNRHEVVPIRRPDSLVKFPNVVGAMVAHPKLPLLYVWTDVRAPDAPKPEEDPVVADMERLVIFSIGNGTLTPLPLSICRGPAFASRTGWHTLVIDPAATRLYISNVRKPGPAGKADAGAGVLMLAPDGMPARRGDGFALTLHDLGGLRANLGFVHGNDDVFIVNAERGPTTVDTANRRARSGTYNLNALVPHAPFFDLRMVGHPDGETFFMTALGSGSLFMMDHTEGYISGRPRRLVVGGASAQSLPVVMPGRRRVAFGGVNKVHVARYDATGRFEPVVEQAAVVAPVVVAICASPKFDRLYAAVESIPEAAP